MASMLRRKRADARCRSARPRGSRDFILRARQRARLSTRLLQARRRCREAITRADDSWLQRHVKNFDAPSRYEYIVDEALICCKIRRWAMRGPYAAALMMPIAAPLPHCFPDALYMAKTDFSKTPSPSLREFISALDMPPAQSAFGRVSMTPAPLASATEQIGYFCVVDASQRSARQDAVMRCMKIHDRHRRYRQPVCWT